MKRQPSPSAMAVRIGGPGRRSAGEGNARPDGAAAESREPGVAERLPGIGYGTNGAVVLEPHEGCGQAARGHDLDDLECRGDVCDAEPTGISRSREAVEPGVREAVEPIDWDDVARVHLERAREKAPRR